MQILSRTSARLHSAIAAVLLACSLSGCLCRFERDWRETRHTCLPADNLAGLWEGTWESCKSGHDGTLRAIVTRCGCGRYTAHYQGTFAAVIPFVYETSHSETASAPGVTHFSGREDLGPLMGGTYRIDGRADGETFIAHYRSDDDCGVFRMQRVGTCGHFSCGGCGMDCASTVP